MYCQLFGKYVNDAECDYCDKRSGYEVGTWRDTCRRDEHHPMIPHVKWWLKPKSFRFKLYIFIRWITKLLPMKSFTIWFDRCGLHVGHWKPNVGWTDSQTLEESKND